MRANDVMTRDPVIVTPDESIARAARLMRDLDIGALPVVDDWSARRLLGVITDRDIATRCSAEAHEASCVVRDHMSTEPLVTCPADAHLLDVIRTMERHQLRRVPIVIADEVVGMVTLADIARRGRSVGAERIAHLLQQLSAPAGVLA